MPQIRPIQPGDVFSVLPRRAADAHKGSFGNVLAVAGSLAYRGAAALCVEGALRAGAGLVYLASVEPAVQLALTRTPEACVLPCRTAPDGGVEPADLTGHCGRLAGPRTVLLAGPGLGAGAAALLPPLLVESWRAAVLDADALNHLPPLARLGLPLPNNTVLTPHPGEAARLLGTTTAAVQADRPGAVRALAQKFRCVAVLKGSGTLIANPNGTTIWQNTTGNPGLARGGSGDVLAGLLAGLLAQGMDPLPAAVCAVWLHGAAADVCAARSSRMTLLPHDLFGPLGTLLAQQKL